MRTYLGLQLGPMDRTERAHLAHTMGCTVNTIDSWRTGGHVPQRKYWSRLRAYFDDATAMKGPHHESTERARSTSPATCDLTRVLIVDSHALVGQCIGINLARHQGIGVVGVVETCRAGAIDAKAEQPDVVLLHLHLDSTVAAHVISELREAAPTARLVIMSDSRTPSARAYLYGAGAHAVVGTCEPFDALLETIRACAGASTKPWYPNAQDALYAPTCATGTTSVLSEREAAILYLMSRGSRSRDIAEDLGITVHTVRSHVARILQKLRAHSRLEAIAVSRRLGLLDAVAQYPRCTSKVGAR